MPPTLRCVDLERMTLESQPRVVSGSTDIKSYSVELELNHRHPTTASPGQLPMYLIDVVVQQDDGKPVEQDDGTFSTAYKGVYTLAQSGSRALAENRYNAIAARLHAGDAVRITGSNTAVLFKPVK